MIRQLTTRFADVIIENTGEHRLVPTSKSQRSAIFRPLSHRNFTLELTGRSVSTLGNGMYTVTLAWTAYQLTRSGSLMAVVLLTNEIPQITLMLFGGVLGDRYSRRLVLMASDGIACAATCMLAATAALHVLHTAELLAGSFMLGVATAIFMPAYGAINQELVPAAELAAANALRNSSANIARIAGPALGGLTYAVGGSALGFGLDAATFAVAITTMWLVRLPAKNVTFERPIIREITEGFWVVRQTQWLRALVLIALTANTFCLAPLLVLLPLVVRSAGYSASFLGLALATQSALSAIFSLLVGHIDGRVRSGFVLYALTAIMAAGACLIGIIPHQRLTILMGAGMIGIGFAFGVVEDTLMQRHIPPEYLSRVYSLSTTVCYALLPLGYLLAAAIARVAGPGLVIAAGGGILGAASVLGIIGGGAEQLTLVPAAQSTEAAANSFAAADVPDASARMSADLDPDRKG